MVDGYKWHVMETSDALWLVGSKCCGSLLARRPTSAILLGGSNESIYYDLVQMTRDGDICNVQFG